MTLVEICTSVQNNSISAFHTVCAVEKVVDLFCEAEVTWIVFPALNSSPDY